MKINSDEIEITIVDTTNKICTLKEILENGPCIFNFILGTWCPMCNTFIKGLIDTINTDQMAKKSIFVVSTESSKKLHNHYEKIIGLENIPFTIISDNKKQLINKLKIQIPVFGFAKPAIVMIMQDGEVKPISKGLPNQRDVDESICELKIRTTR